MSDASAQLEIMAVLAMALVGCAAPEAPAWRFPDRPPGTDASTNALQIATPGRATEPMPAVDASSIAMHSTPPAPPVHDPLTDRDYAGVSVLEHIRDLSAQVAAPTILFAGPIVRLAYPKALSDEDPSRNGRFVVLRKIRGPGAGETLTAPVRRGEAEFRNLGIGAYEAYYRIPDDSVTVSRGSNQSPSPDRRILIDPAMKNGLPDSYRAVPAGFSTAYRQQAASAENSSMPARLSIAAPDAERAPRSHDSLEMAGQHSGRAWRLLQRGQIKDAIEAFKRALERAARDPADLQVLFAPDAAFAEGEWVQRLLDVLGREPRLSRTVRGLAKAHEVTAWRKEPDSMAARTWAGRCYLAAITLDQQSAEAANDYGAFLARGGDWAGAAAQLERAVAIYPEARYLYNLGRCRFELGAIHDAMDCYRAALIRDEAFGPAMIELARIRFSSQGRAISIAEAELLPILLDRIGAEYGAESPEGSWAKRIRKELEFLEREMAANKSSAQDSAKERHIVPERPSAAPELGTHP